MAAAILTLRRGTTTPSLSQSELFFNTTTNTLNVGGTSGVFTLVKIGSNTGNITLIGNLNINGGISGSTLDITGNAKIDGNVQIGGNIILGTGSNDIITVNAPFTGSLIPQEDAQDDLGSITKRFNELHVVSASIDSISLPGSGILSSSNENFTTFSQSVDSRLDNLQLFTSSQEDLNQTFATTGSNTFIGDQTISGSLIVSESIISQVYINPKTLNGFTVPDGHNAMLVGPVDINGSVTLEGDSSLLILDKITLPDGLLSSSTTDFDTFSSSLDDKFATLGSNTFIGDQTITGSIFMSGSTHQVGNVFLSGSLTVSGSSTFTNIGLTVLSGSTLVSGSTFQTGSIDVNGDVIADNLQIRGTNRFLTADSDQLIVSSSTTYFSGDVNVFGSVTASAFSGSFVGTLPSQDGRLDNLELFTSSQEDLNQTFATTGSNTFIGTESIVGNLTVTGSIFANLKNHTLSTSGSELTVSNRTAQLSVQPSGSLNFGTLTLIDNDNTLSTAHLFASEIRIGQSSITDNIFIGNNNSNTTITGNVNFDNDITASQSITASYFVGDGSGLINVTAGDVEFENILNKPTLVSGSAQIDVNNTQNFTTFSSSVDGRLDTLENSFSTSVDSRLDSIEAYTSSLKTAIDVTGQDLTIYGNLTVQGETTTLNTTELIIEDKVLSLASGSTTSAQADGAGLHISGANASLLWEDLTSTLVFNQKVSSSVGFKGDGSELTGVTATGVDFDDITNKPTLVSGSSQVTSSLDFRYLEINGDNVVSGSSQIDITQTTGYTTFSGSFGNRLTSLELDSASQDVRISNLETVSGSQDVRLSNLESFTSSQDAKNSALGTYTSSIDDKFDALQTYTQSIDADLSNLHLYTQSIDSKFSTLGTYTASVDTKFGNLESYTASVDDKFDALQTYTQSIDADLNSLHLYTQSNDTNITNLYNSASQYQSFSQSIDSTIKNKLNVEGVLSSSSDTSTIDFTITNGVISGNVIGGVVSGSSQVTQSLDSRYEVSGSVADLVGIYQVSGSLGSAAWYNVTTSLDVNLSTSSLNDNVILSAGATKRFIVHVLDNVINPADITSVTAGDGLNGGGNSGDVTLTLDTASQHFIDGVNTTISTFSQSVDTRLDNLEIFSSSLDAGFVTQTELANATSSLISSIATKLDTGSYLNDSQSFDTRLDSLESFSSSLDNGFVTQQELSSATSSLIDSINTKLDTGSFNTISQSIDSRLDELELFSSSLDSGFVTQQELGDATSSLISSIATKLDTGSYLNDSQSFDSRLDSLETNSASLENVFEEKASGTHTLVSGSSQLTSSYDNRYVTLAGDQTIGDTKTFNNIIVNGTGSFSYIESVTGSAKIIGDAFIQLNNNTPSERYAGIIIVDSGSIPSTASFYFDGQTNDWGYEYSGSSGVDYAVTIFGPEYATKGNPTYLTSNRIPKAVDNHHLNDSNISDSGTLITLNSNSQVNGNLVVNGTVSANNIISGSSQISYPDLSNIPAGIVSGSSQITPLLPSGVVSGSSQVNADSITNFDTNVKDKLNADAVVSGSSQITKSLQDVTSVGNTTSTSISITNSTASTSKTTGALVVTGGIGTSGDVFAGGDVVAYASSDRRLKDEITPISEPLEKINKIGGYSFTWNEEKQNIYRGKDYGVIAQEIEEILPELVDTRENGFKAVKYDKLVSLLIEGIKDLSKQVEELKEKVNNQ